MSAAPTPAAPQPTDERRIAPRRQPAMGTVCRLDSSDGGPAPLALVWNISRTGVSMLLSAPVPSGTALGVCPRMIPLVFQVIHRIRV